MVVFPQSGLREGTRKEAHAARLALVRLRLGEHLRFAEKRTSHTARFPSMQTDPLKLVCNEPISVPQL